jgi:hypothetical protein
MGSSLRPSFGVTPRRRRQLFAKRTRKLVGFGLLGLLVMAPLFAAAQAPPPDDLGFYRNYFVTGDYITGSVGLRGRGDASGFATGTISIPDPNSVPSTGVPAGADIVAAFLYWQTVEKSQSAFIGQNGFFNGHAIKGTVLGNPNAPVSWSAGGCAGSSNGTTTLRTYRVDVRPFLDLVAGSVQAAGPYQVRLADSGSNGGGAPLTLGATLVVVYRVMSPAFPLKAISFYDGAFAPGNGSSPFSLTIRGFYQASNTVTPDIKLTHIVGNGQPNKGETVSLNGLALLSLYTNLPPFPGFYNGSWDSPTWAPNGAGAFVHGDDASALTTVTPNSTNSGCVSWAAVIFSTTVQDTDNDGLLDVWEANQGYTDLGTNTFVPLPGADPLRKDLFVHLDYLASHDFITSGGTQGHTHRIKQAALDMVGDMYKNAPVDCDPISGVCKGIALHVDCNNCYPGDPYVIAGTGGNVIDEFAVACQDNPAANPPFYCEFPGVPATSWKGGLVFLKNQFFNRSQKDSYRYLLSGHALGLAGTLFRISNGTLISINVTTDAGGNETATVTTASAHGLASGARVRVSGSIAPAGSVGPDFGLNGSYPSITVTSATTFTFPVAKVPTGVYNNQGLFVSSGPALSTSGWSDLGGADTIVTLGLWRSDIPGDDQVGSVLVQAGTLAHELGHTFGRRHGGDDNSNCKSNFQSVMNYEFQVRGLPGYDGIAHVNYSTQVLPTLNENSLSEPAGIGATATTYRTRWYAPFSFLDKVINSAGGRFASRHCDGTDITDGAQMVRIEGPFVPGAIDWTQDGNAIATGVVQDISFNGSLDPSLAGSNDWLNLDLRQIGARRGVAGFSGEVWGTADDGGGGTVDDGGGGTADDGGGGTADDGGGGTADDGGGGTEGDVDRANATVDAPLNVTAAQVGKTVVLNWNPPSFGLIRSYNIWRANTTNGPISATNLPTRVGTVQGTPAPTTFTDKSLKNNTTYTYFVTSVLGADSGKNNGNQSGPSNFVSVAVKF